MRMAAKKKAYQRFSDLTRKAMAPATDEGEGGTGSVDFVPEEELTVWLAPEVRRAVHQRAAADQTTPSEVVEKALRRYLKAPGGTF